MRLIDVSTLCFVTPPVAQGQMIEVSYAWAPHYYTGALVRRTHDSSTRETWYAIANGSTLDESWNPTMGAPTLDDELWDGVCGDDR